MRVVLLLGLFHNVVAASAQRFSHSVSRGYDDGIVRAEAMASQDSIRCRCALSFIPEPTDRATVEWYTNGCMKAMRIVRDKGQGRSEIGWYPDGQKRIEIEVAGRKKHGYVREWYESGDLKSESAILGCENHGWMRQWSEDGTLTRRDYFRNGKWKRGRAFR